MQKTTLLSGVCAVALTATFCSPVLGYAVASAIQVPDGGIIYYEVTVAGGDAAITDFELEVDPADVIGDYAHGYLEAGWTMAGAFVVRGGKTYLSFAGPALGPGGPYLFDVHYYGPNPNAMVDVDLTVGGVPVHTEAELGWFAPAGAPAVSEWGLIAVALLLLAIGTTVFVRRRRAVGA